MQVILLQDVKNVGKKDTTVKVNDGYARNFLIPKGFAVEATATSLNDMKEKNKAAANKKQRELEQAKSLADKLDKISLTFKIKAGENGKLFGSVTAKDISDALKKENKIDVDKKKILLPDPIKALGKIEVEIKVHVGVTAKITVTVEQE